MLEGLREIPHLEAALRHRAMGFPIEVRYNGESLPQPRALDGSFSFERTEVGEVYLYGAMPGEDWTYASDEIACYLQGLPVYACGYGGRSGRAAIVHLDPTRFLARLPDRDRLIDEPEAINAVRAAIKAVALARLQVQKVRLAPEEFIRGFRSLRHWGALALLNDVPFLPAEVVWSISDYPIVPRWDGDGIEGYGTSIPEGSVEASEVRLAKLERMYEDEPGGAVRWVFAWKADYTLIDADFLDAEHWVHRHVKDLDGAELNLEVVSPGKAVPFEPGRWLWGRTVRVCKGYRITMAEETVEITDAGLYHCSGEDAEENGEILIPERERVVVWCTRSKISWTRTTSTRSTRRTKRKRLCLHPRPPKRDARGDARRGAAGRPAPGLSGARGAQLPRADREGRSGHGPSERVIAQLPPGLPPRGPSQEPSSGRVFRKAKRVVPRRLRSKPHPCRRCTGSIACGFSRALAGTSRHPSPPRACVVR